ncbi:uncharacterized protein PMUG01_05040300 [Plasmodium malariae]|uniref:Uncharacterized protein n=1 Tax=Plasmodium malariae TaxID=5858 RepID=A0A1D3JLS1_PLAMA|nr:uncharacterized protein PMUG01_05040300 [Plasmodium malariae]SBT87541.1 hypothetical protein PMUG01_05040300 [Plasmodium malariae]
MYIYKIFCKKNVCLLLFVLLLQITIVDCKEEKNVKFSVANIWPIKGKEGGGTYINDVTISSSDSGSSYRSGSSNKDSTDSDKAPVLALDNNNQKKPIKEGGISRKKEKQTIQNKSSETANNTQITHHKKSINEGVSSEPVKGEPLKKDLVMEVKKGPVMEVKKGLGIESKKDAIIESKKDAIIESKKDAIIESKKDAIIKQKRCNNKSKKRCNNRIKKRCNNRIKKRRNNRIKKRCNNKSKKRCNNKSKKRCNNRIKKRCNNKSKKRCSNKSNHRRKNKRKKGSTKRLKKKSSFFQIIKGIFSKKKEKETPKTLMEYIRYKNERLLKLELERGRKDTIKGIYKKLFLTTTLLLFYITLLPVLVYLYSSYKCREAIMQQYNNNPDRRIVPTNYDFGGDEPTVKIGGVRLTKCRHYVTSGKKGFSFILGRHKGQSYGNYLAITIFKSFLNDEKLKLVQIIYHQNLRKIRISNVCNYEMVRKYHSCDSHKEKKKRKKKRSNGTDVT